MTVLVLLFAVGFAVLVGGAYFLVNGASSLAKRLSISEIVIGLTIVAFGTSAPEMVVNVYSSVGGYHDVVFGNVIGSNIFNIFVILGISGLIYPLSVQKNTVWKEIPFSLFAILVFFVLVNDHLVLGSSVNTLSGLDGAVLLLMFIVFLLYAFVISKIKSTDSFSVEVYSLPKTLAWILVGFVALFLGGKLVVDNAVLIAGQIGVSSKLIALTIVAGGTSLPELATSAVAACKKRCDIAVGNIIGSNIFNVFFILGVSSMIGKANYDAILNIDLFVLIAGTTLLFFTMFTGKRRRLDRWEAVLLLVGYAIYLSYLLYRR